MYFYTVSLPRDISSKETHVWRSSLSLYITASLTNYNASFSSSPLSVVWTTLRHYIHIFHPLHLFEFHSTSQHSFRWHISLVGIYIYACCSTIRPTETDREHELSRAVLYTYIYMHAEQTKRKIGDTLGGREREKSCIEMGTCTFQAWSQTLVRIAVTSIRNSRLPPLVRPVLSPWKRSRASARNKPSPLFLASDPLPFQSSLRFATFVSFSLSMYIYVCDCL